MLRFLLKLLSPASRSHRLFCIKCLEAACKQNIQGVVELSRLYSYRGCSASGETHLPSSLFLFFFFSLVFHCLRFMSVVYFGKTAVPGSPALALLQRIRAGSQKAIWDKQGT